MIEDGKSVGVVLTVEEYEKLSSPLLISEINSGNKTKETELEVKNKPTVNPIGVAMAQEMDFPEASANIDDINLTDEVTLEDLGLDELPPY